MRAHRIGIPRQSAWVALLLLSASAIATARAASCGDLATQAEMNRCANADFKTADAALNDVYGQIVARLKDDPDAKTLLVAAQRAWLGFRDAECAFASSKTAGGSIHPFIVTECKAFLTNQRTKQLRANLSCQEGDLSCPVPSP